MVRKQNERTILLHSRIIQLSLPIQSFHILAPLAPFLQDWGLSLSHETFSRKFFPKFFPILPRRLFSGFLVRKIMGVKGTCRSPNGGGCPFSYAHHTAKVSLFHPTSPSPFTSPTVANFQTNRAKRGKSKHFLA